MKENHFGHWNTVTVWTAESRYNAIGTAREADTTAMIDAAERLLAVL
jgi:hypothetical protein